MTLGATAMNLMLSEDVDWEIQKMEQTLRQVHYSS
jgi:hypothetical protein